MTWAINAEFTGQRVQGIGQGYPPRGGYIVITKETEAPKASDEWPEAQFLQFVHRIEAAHIFVEETKGFDLDPKQVNREIFNRIYLRGGYKADWDADLRKSLDDMREGELGAAIVSHSMGQITREQMEASRGAMPVNSANFDNRRAFIIYDPPPAGVERKKAYAEIRYVTEETFKLIVTGQRPVNWPWDAKTARGQTAKAAGTAVAGMLPTGGNPAPRPAVAPVVAAAPAGPMPPTPVQAAAPVAPVPPNGGGAAVTTPPAQPAAAGLAGGAGAAVPGQTWGQPQG